MTDRPGFIDELGAEPDQPSAEKSSTTLPLPTEPFLFEVGDGAPKLAAGKIDVGWSPAFNNNRRSKFSSVGWIVLSFIVLFISWIIVSLVDFVIGQFNRSYWLGWLTASLFVVSGLLFGLGIILEARAWSRLRHVDSIRKTLVRNDIEVAELKVEVLRWLRDVQGRLTNPTSVISAVENAASQKEVLKILEDRVTGVMKRTAQHAGSRAAAEAAALVAMISSPTAEGVIVGIRSLILVREIARVYGIRPGLITTFILLRRIAWTAAVVAGTDVLARGVIESALHKVPYVKDLVASFPEVSVTALRLYRLATVTASACCPTKV